MLASQNPMFANRIKTIVVEFKPTKQPCKHQHQQPRCSRQQSWSDINKKKNSTVNLPVGNRSDFSSDMNIIIENNGNLNAKGRKHKITYCHRKKNAYSGDGGGGGDGIHTHSVFPLWMIRYLLPKPLHSRDAQPSSNDNNTHTRVRARQPKKKFSF